MYLVYQICFLSYFKFLFYVGKCVNKDQWQQIISNSSSLSCNCYDYGYCTDTEVLQVSHVLPLNFYLFLKARQILSSNITPGLDLVLCSLRQLKCHVGAHQGIYFEKRTHVPYYQCATILYVIDVSQSRTCICMILSGQWAFLFQM